MHSLELPQPLAPPAAVVTARDLVRRYGSGDTAVDALRGVSVDIAERRLTAVMGPSGSGKSTLMTSSPGSTSRRRARCRSPAFGFGPQSAPSSGGW
jgi:ABC-type glutathione transport system ATPase component